MAILDRFSLDGKVVLVTGGSSGLGVAFAHGCAEAGADVVVAARRAEKLEQTADLVRTTGRRALAVVTDVADPAQCQALVDTGVEAFGRVDVLVNNAGIGPVVPALRETPEQFRSVVETNLNGTYWVAQACGRIMQPGSSIVNVSSVLGMIAGGVPAAAYAASKAGIMGLTRDLAHQWGARKGIRVNALVPGFFPSEMTDRFPPAFVDGVNHRTVLQRMGDPIELAATLVWLASDAASYVTGQAIVVDGGLTIA